MGGRQARRRRQRSGYQAAVRQRGFQHQQQHKNASLREQCVSCVGGRRGRRRPMWVQRAMRPCGLHLMRVHCLAVGRARAGAAAGCSRRSGGAGLGGRLLLGANGLDGGACTGRREWGGEEAGQKGSWGELVAPHPSAASSAAVAATASQNCAELLRISHATVLTMSATVQPRDRSFTGLARPCVERGSHRETRGVKGRRN